MNRETNGIWWIPNFENQKLHGTIVVSTNGKVNLNIFGKLKNGTNNVDFIGGEIANYPIINGRTIDGSEITLVDCELSGEHINVDGITNQTYSPSFAYIGKILTNIEDLKFNSASVSLSYLSSWFADTGFQQKNFSNKDNRFEYNLTYSMPKEIEVRNSDYRLVIVRTFKSKGNYRTGLELKEGIRISITLNERVDIYSLFEIFIRPLQNLVTLSANKPSQILELFVNSSYDNNKPSDQFEVIFEKSFWQEENSQDIIERKMLFRAKDIEQGYESFFNNWLRLSDALKDVFSFLFAPIYNKTMYLQSEYFTIIQAVEGIHRSLLNQEGINRFRQIALSEDEFKEKRRLIKCNIPPEHRKWFYEKTQYNEPSLKQRIIDLTNYLEKYVGYEIFNLEIVPQKAADFRNILAHPQSSRTIARSEFEGVVYIQEILRYIVYIVIFIELGFAPQFINKIINDKLMFYINKINQIYNLEKRTTSDSK